ncbi:hypothetical protein AGDE_12805 [Angomonas deanei]|nr:hypothetical protein AGDE_12805 [Angomonas deanei]|eukprot:EPY23445.1 hypothetical protein AGDE_12805 [Angomonas deanei]
MRHHGHPEAAFYIRDIGGQVRASLYLPLPTHFGIRGGFGIAPTSGVAKDLCALSAVDVLCFVNAIPPECLERPEWQAMLQKRKALRLLLPGDAHNVAKLTDSPPGYVGIAGGSQYIPSLQRINEIRSADVSFYDVVPPIVDGAFADRTVILRALDGLADMLVTYVRYATGNEMYMQMHLFHYKGIQQFRRSRRLMANNLWMPLPLMGDTLGKHMAHGRGESRADARRHFLLHAFRILRYLDALPWDHLDDNGSFADSNAAQLQTEVQYLTVLEKEGFLPPARKNANAAKRVTEIPRPLISFVLKEKSTR